MNDTTLLSQILKTFYEKNTLRVNGQITEFLNATLYNTKATTAQKLIKGLIKENDKEHLAEHIDELYEIESATRPVSNNRDHVVHAVNTFLLGWYINEKFLQKNKVDLFQWKLTALFHDIAYPLEISQSIMNRYIEKIKDIEKIVDLKKHVPYMQVKPVGFEMLSNNVSAFDLIQKRIEKWKIDVNIKKQYSEMTRNNKICHGMISALTVLHLIDLMYQKENPGREKLYTKWSQDFFENDVVSACSAIFLHNLKEETIFNHIKTKSPLAYLLKLSDELQDWERPKKDLPEGNPRENYSIAFENKKLIFYTVNYKEQKQAISCLKDDNVILLRKKLDG